jgi:RNA polymerase sigma factor (sigma-70 family)
MCFTLSNLGEAMLSDVTVNDTILQPFLLAQNSAESQRQLMILLSQHAEARMRGIIVARLHSYFSSQEHSADLEDLYSEAKTRLLIYLYELKKGLRTAPCEDFRGYVAAIAHNACHDHFRQMYPARTRLHKKIRDLLQAHPNFALWRSQDQNKGDWICGFQCWRGRKTSNNSTAWLHHFYENPETVIETLASGGDIQSMETHDLLASIFKDVGEPINLTDVVSVVSDIRGVKDTPVASFEANEASLSFRLPDSRLRVDSALEMREPLGRMWQGLRELRRDQFRAYLLYARDSSGEDLITLLLAAGLTTEAEIAPLLGMTLDQFRDLWLKLPLDSKSISQELGVTLERVYKLRFRAGKRLKSYLAEIMPEKKWLV